MSMTEKIVQRIATGWPFANGSGRFIDIFAKRIDLGNAERICRTTDGFEMSVISGDLIGRHIYLSGKFDRSIANTLQLFGEPGDIIADIGANIGYVSCVLLQNIKDSTVYCVEPQPNISKLLHKNLNQFGPKRSTVLEAALSNHSGTVRMVLIPENLGASSIRNDQEGPSITVPCLHASEYFAQFSRLDLMKVDVEGHEEVLFAAAEKELARLQPKAIVFECHGNEAEPDGPLGQVLDRCGYDVYGIQKTLLKTVFQHLSTHSHRNYNDYLAVSRTRKIPSSIRAALPRVG